MRFSGSLLIIFEPLLKNPAEPVFSSPLILKNAQDIARRRMNTDNMAENLDVPCLFTMKDSQFIKIFNSKGLMA